MAENNTNPATGTSSASVLLKFRWRPLRRHFCVRNGWIRLECCSSAGGVLSGGTSALELTESALSAAQVPLETSPAALLR